MTTIHIIAGLLALLTGAVALFARKGSTLHRRSGTVFVVAMLVMSGSGALMALTVKPNPVNVVAGSLTFYLVCTAWLTVKRSVSEVRRPLRVLMVAALLLGAAAFVVATLAMLSPTGRIGGVPAPPILLFGVIGILGGSLDARLLRVGTIVGPQRLARHLWRMTLALWIATASFFLGQAKVFPDALRRIELLAIPVVVVLVMLLFWMVRVWWFLPHRRAIPRTADTLKGGDDAADRPGRTLP
jgi:uncharacterized membrane protein